MNSLDFQLPDGLRTGDFAIAVLVPCLNEAATITRVVNRTKEAIPGAKIYVYDNG